MKTQTKRRILIAASSAFLFLGCFFAWGWYSITHMRFDFPSDSLLKPIIQEASASMSDAIAVVPADDLANVGRGRSPRFLPPAVMDRKEELANFALLALAASDQAKSRSIPFILNKGRLDLCVSGNEQRLVVISDKSRPASDFCRASIPGDLLTDFPEGKVVVTRSGSMLVSFRRRTN